MNGTSVTLFVPILDGKNYIRWSAQVRVLFDYHELLTVIDNGVEDIAANATDAQKVAHHDMQKKDKKALYLIHQSVTDEVFEKITAAKSSKEAWDTLRTTY